MVAKKEWAQPPSRKIVIQKRAQVQSNGRDNPSRGPVGEQGGSVDTTFLENQKVVIHSLVRYSNFNGR